MELRFRDAQNLRPILDFVLPANGDARASIAGCMTAARHAGPRSGSPASAPHNARQEAAAGKPTMKVAE